MRPSWKKAFFSLCRTLHVYLMMLGLLVMLLFGLTGFTLNHEDWFGATTPRMTESAGLVPRDLLARQDRLETVEFLRAHFHPSGAVTGYTDLGDQLAIAFKEPGQTWEFEIEKATGKTTLRNEAFNFVAIINNLHRGRYAGAAWSWVIDVTALLIVIACATGLVLWVSLPNRRRLGVIFLSLGVVGMWLILHFLVPGADAGPR